MSTLPKGAVLSLVLALLLTLPLRAATFVLNPSADAFVTTGLSGNLSANNYGAAGALSVAAPGLPKGEFQSVLQFDLSGARASFDAQFGANQWTLRSLSLSLTATSPNNTIFNSSNAGQFSVSWMQNDSWTEGSGTPNVPPASGITFSSLQSLASPSDETLGTFSFNGATSGSATYSLNLTPAFSAETSAGNLVNLRLSVADNSISYLFDSRNFGTASARPVLSIVAVPEPSPLFLLGGGMAVLLGGASRRWKR